MKVFCCKNQCSYGGGLILVAANTKEEAYLTAAYDDKTSYLFDWFEWNRSPFGHISAPTHQMAMKWLREEKRIFIRIIEDCTGKVFRYEIYNHTPNNNGNYYISNTYVDSYEEAVEAALKYSLENLI